MSTGNTDEIQTQRQRDTCLSHLATQTLDIWTWGDGEGPDRSEPRAGGSPGRVLGGREHLSGVYVVICKMWLHLFFSLTRPWYYLGGLGEVSGTGSVMVGDGFREDSGTPPYRPRLPGTYSFHWVTS